MREVGAAALAGPLAGLTGLLKLDLRCVALGVLKKNWGFGHNMAAFKKAGGNTCIGGKGLKRKAVWIVHRLRLA